MSEEESELTTVKVAQNGDESSQHGQQIDSRHHFSWEAASVFLLLLVLLIGSYFRFSGLNWDGNHHLHPDERFLTIVASSLESVSDPLSYLRTSESPLNPYNVGQSFYVYGNFPMTLTRYVAEWTNSGCTVLSGIKFSLCNNPLTSYDGIYLVGRFLSGLMDLISIMFTFLIGRRLYDWRVGLLAALLLALAVMPIQQSHFFTMDNWAAALTTMTLYAAVRAASLGDHSPLTPRPPLHWYAFFGLGVGLTAASRINVAPLALMIGVSALIWLLRRNDCVVPSLESLIDMRGPDLRPIIAGIALAAIISIITFRLAQPYAFTDTALAKEQAYAQTGQEPGTLELAFRSLAGFNLNWLSNMEEIQRLQAPEASFPPALQWTDRAPILFPLTNMILYGMGLTAGLAALLGFIWALWRMVLFRSDWMSHAIPVIWSGFYFLFMGTRWVKSVRYFLPIYPTMFLLAAWALFALWDRAGRSNSSSRSFSTLKRALVGFLMLLVIVPSFLWANTFVTIYQRPVTRIAASEWIFENVPSGATLLYDVNGEAREHNLPLKEFIFLPDSIPLTISFTMPEEGVITAVRLNHLTDYDFADGGSETDTPEDAGETFHVRLNGKDINADPGSPGEGRLKLGDERQAILFDLPDTPALAGTAQQIIIELGEGGPVHAGTSILANEHWDDLLPVGSNGRNAYGMYYT